MSVKNICEARTRGVRSRVLHLGLLGLLVVVVAAACGDDTTPTAPTNPLPPPVTHTFTGTINTNSAATHSFSALTSGRVTATLTQVDPEVMIGFSVGTLNVLQVCQVSLDRNPAGKATEITGNVNASGEICVRVYDVGNITTPITYEIQVNYQGT